jgi:tetratricopeptide (TPR) repeat protein
MKSFLLNVLAGCLLFCLPVFATAQSAYEKGWTAFNENNRDEAESQFKSATENAESAPDAWLSLALLYYSMDKETESHDAFLKFLTVSKNPYPYVYSLWSTDIGFGGSSKLSKLDLAAFKKIFADKALNGTIRAMMNQRMGDHWENSNQFKKA